MCEGGPSYPFSILNILQTDTKHCSVSHRALREEEEEEEQRRVKQAEGRHLSSLVPPPSPNTHTHTQQIIVRPPTDGFKPSGTHTHTGLFFSVSLKIIFPQ